MKWFLSLFLAGLLTGCTSSTARLDVSRQSLNLEGVVPEAVFFVSNEGAPGSILEWEVAAASASLSVSPDEGRLLGGTSAQVVVRLLPGDAAPDQPLQTALSVASNGGRATVAVSYRSDDSLPSCARPNTPSGPPGSPSARSGDPVVGDPATSDPATGGTPAYVAGELLVKFAPLGAQSAGLEPHSLAQIAHRVAADYALELGGPVQPERPTLVRVPPGRFKAVARALASDPRVAYAEPNYYLETLATPDDPRLSEQWNLLDFGLPQAWTLQTGAAQAGAGVVLAVIDSAVDTAHVDLQQKSLPGYDFFDQDTDPRPGPGSPEPDHGTHVAGIALATGDNATGVAGVAYGGGAELLPIKVFPDAPGTGDVNALLDALLWAAGLEVEGVGTNPHPAQIINMSLGVRPADVGTGTLKSIDDVTKRVYERGVVMFAAAGNDGVSTFIRSPANSPWVCAVGSVESDYRRSNFSDYAANGESVDFMAPGGLKPGSLCGSVLSTFADDDYGCLAGTSMASPFVAGVAALVLSQTPGLSPTELLTRLADSARFEPYMSAPEYGAGVVCADRALGAATLCGRAP